jgi:hypothetical protein
MDRLNFIESNWNSISINYHLIQWCNFKCSYCIDKPNRDWRSSSTLSNFDDFITFIIDLDKLYSWIKISIWLIGWEPLLHKDIFYLIEKLFSIKSIHNNTIKVLLMTNWYLIHKYNDEILKYSWNSLFVFNISYHFYEYKKYDFNKKIFFSNIKFLIKNNIKFTIFFLLPNVYEDFLDSKSIISDLLKLDGFSFDNLQLVLIRVDWEPISYTQEMKDYYKSINLSTLKNNNLNLKVNINWDDLNISSDELFIKRLNKFKWFKCYPFRINTFLTIDEKMNVMFIWCRSLSQEYSLKETISILWRKENNEKYVYCVDNVCDCTTAFWLKRIFDDKVHLYNNLLFSKLGKYFNINWLELLWIDYLNSTLGINVIEITFKYEKFTIIFWVEEKKEWLNYMHEDSGLWFHYYLKNDEWEIVKNSDFSKSIIFNIVNTLKNLLPIFTQVIKKWNETFNSNKII